MSNLGDLTERARYCREYGVFDGLHGELLDMVELLESELEAERVRATEHFDARMSAVAKLGALGEVCAQPFDVFEVEQDDGSVIETAVVRLDDIHACLTSSPQSGERQSETDPLRLTDSELLYELAGALHVYARSAHARIPALIEVAQDRAAMFLRLEG
ncbi:hypothetical protein Mycsm_06969 (plasmid) [Mycobacterium sp. JS623]|uniref:hypothetical protein n=1 Tax=Mycobacterium sp. JS623 TaxID=212767 RepID=UPI0002A58706|nr:hypothetical protein [Mycobacterium sp. JS623]AGB27070.1 hypothetical protein Mycsm_06969 [Mycobacterium sp. JS623]